MTQSALDTNLPVLLTERLLLRQPAPADVAARVEIPRDPEENRLYGGSGEPKRFNPDEVTAHLATFADQDLTIARKFVISALVWPDGQPVTEPEGRFIGSIRLDGISWNDRQARLAIGIFDRRFWSQGYGTEAIKALLAYAFDGLRLHRIGLRVLAHNARAIRCYEKCGFSREGIERQAALINGTWYDDLIMGILEQEYQAQPWAHNRSA